MVMQTRKFTIITLEPDLREEKIKKKLKDMEHEIKDLSAIRRKDASPKEAELIGKLRYNIWSLIDILEET